MMIVDISPHNRSVSDFSISGHVTYRTMLLCYIDTMCYYVTGIEASPV